MDKTQPTNKSKTWAKGLAKPKGGTQKPTGTKENRDVPFKKLKKKKG